MAEASREFQIFVKPVGSTCNLSCHYCYYLGKEQLYPKGIHRMSEEILEAYIAQHIEAFPGSVTNFSWHGGEPTMLGVDYFRKIVALQRKHQPPGRLITNGIQTNGTLLDEEWCRFLAKEKFGVGLSIDGPQDLHNQHRVTKNENPTFEQAMHGYNLLRRYQIPIDILCVVHSHNVHYPIHVYEFFKQMGAQYLTFLPLVERQPDAEFGVSALSVKPDDWGNFLCSIFDEWLHRDIGQVKIQIFEEAARTAFGQEHALCIFRKTCGDIPVIEHNGDFFTCDHFVDPEHRLGNIKETDLVELIESPIQRAFGQSKLTALPRYCLSCEVLDMCYGGCPKDRILQAPDGGAGLNYLCAGYKQFFTHCRPFIAELSLLSHQQGHERQGAQTPSTTAKANPKAGRNAPCPCGSGRKYKKCCLDK